MNRLLALSTVISCLVISQLCMADDSSSNVIVVAKKPIGQYQHTMAVGLSPEALKAQLSGKISLRSTQMAGAAYSNNNLPIFTNGENAIFPDDDESKLVSIDLDLAQAKLNVSVRSSLSNSFAKMKKESPDDFDEKMAGLFPSAAERAALLADKMRVDFGFSKCQSILSSQGQIYSNAKREVSLIANKGLMYLLCEKDRVTARSEIDGSDLSGPLSTISTSSTAPSADGDASSTSSKNQNKVLFALSAEKMEPDFFTIIKGKKLTSMANSIQFKLVSVTSEELTNALLEFDIDSLMPEASLASYELEWKKRNVDGAQVVLAALGGYSKTANSAYSSLQDPSFNNAPNTYVMNQPLDSDAKHFGFVFLSGK